MSTDTGSNGNTSFHSDVDAASKLEALRNDASQHKQPASGPPDTYFSRAQRALGEELGRYQGLIRGQQQIVGQGPVPYPAQPNHPFAVDVGNVERPLGYSVEDLPDMTRVKS